MDGGIYSVKKPVRGAVRRLVRGTVKSKAPPISDVDLELSWLMPKTFKSNQLTKAPRRKK